MYPKNIREMDLVHRLQDYRKEFQIQNLSLTNLLNELHARVYALKETDYTKTYQYRESHYFMQALEGMKKKYFRQHQTFIKNRYTGYSPN